MADWDADSPQLRQNLLEVLRQARDDARQRKSLSLETLRQWHRDIMYGHAGEQAMQGNWHPTARFFRRSLSHFLRQEKGAV